MNHKNEVEIFFPVDVSNVRTMCSLLEEVAEHVDVLKIGLEVMNSVGFPLAIEIAKEFNRKIMIDCKMSDIPNTVAGGIAGVSWQDIDYLNIVVGNCQASAVKAAVDKIKEIETSLSVAGKNIPELIAVTLMTSWGVKDLGQHGIFLPPWWKFSTDPEQQINNIVNMVNAEVDGIIPAWDGERDKRLLPESEAEKGSFMSYVALKWGKIAVDSGVRCLLSSPREAPAFKLAFPHCDFISPGIRLSSSPKDDQKRTLTPYEAVKAGVRKLVIGRPIRNPADGKSRTEVVEEIREDIKRAELEMSV